MATFCYVLERNECNLCVFGDVVLCGGVVQLLEGKGLHTVRLPYQAFVSCVSLLFTDVPEHATKLQRLSQIHIKEQVSPPLCLPPSAFLCVSLSLISFIC